MIHSASFRATGSDIAAAACVASAGFLLRTSSMTFSTASVSACDVDDVAAIAAGGGGFRAGGGGSAACWRVAGLITGAAVAASAAVGWAEGLAAAVVLGTTLRAIGRGFGSGTFAFAETSTANN